MVNINSQNVELTKKRLGWCGCLNRQNPGIKSVMIAADNFQANLHEILVLLFAGLNGLIFGREPSNE